MSNEGVKSVLIGWLARNLLAAIRQQPTRPFRHRSRGAMAAIGHRKGVAQAMGLPRRGLPAWLLWRVDYLSQMPTLGRKLRIFVEWTLGLFFPNDITHLRFIRSPELDRDAAQVLETLGAQPTSSVRGSATASTAR